MKLGLHRLGRWLEDDVNMGIALVVVWAVGVWLVSIAVALGTGTTLLLIAAGIAVTLLLRRPVAALAYRWRDRRLELERQHGQPA